MELYLFFMTVMTFLLYGWDKRAAEQGSWRIPEQTLLLCGLAGGTVGAYAAMRVFRHKTSKLPFQVKFWLVTGVQAAVLLLKLELLAEGIRSAFPV